MKNAVPIHFMELERRYEKLLWWCDVLQAIADFLPCHIDEGLCGRISSDLMPLLLTTYELEDRLHCSAALKRAMEHQESEEASSTALIQPECHGRLGRYTDRSGRGELPAVMGSRRISDALVPVPHAPADQIGTRDHGIDSAGTNRANGGMSGGRRCGMARSRRQPTLPSITG
ncbi:hypothetical protein RCCGEPOP_02366 [Rhizobium sp. Pop5]|nr:hypothetical protein RCCGEPOP_02366 [Rhizobium sp. Pop5]